MAVAAVEHSPDMARSDWLRRLLLAGFIVIFLTLIYIQIIRKEYYLTEVAPTLVGRGTALGPQPGSILTRDGQVLAESLLTNKVFADPLFMTQFKESLAGVAEELSPLLKLPAEELLARMQKRQNMHYVELARWVDHDVSEQVRALRVKGLGLEPEWKREYRHQRMAAHLLGGRDKNHGALSGLEHRYRLLLDGVRGSALPMEDPLNLNGTGDERVAEAPGRDLVLTIHSQLQRQVEVELDRLWERERPRWATAMVADPTTGAILAMSTRPNYDPNAYVTGKPAPGHKWSPVPAGVSRNIPVTEAIEQGSTFKILLAAAALEAGVVTPGTTFHCGGTISMGGPPIGCWGKWKSKGHGTLDVRGMIAQSCNVCAAQIAVRLGAERYCAFLKKAGITSDPEAGFAAEALGRVMSPKSMRRRDLATMGFGQNVSCSGLQLTSIVSGIVNGGIMKHPHVLAAALNKDGTVFRRTEVSEKYLCSPQTSAQIRQMLQYAVEHGTGRPVKMDGFNVGGKTGTAQQWDRATRRYTDKYMVSFIEVAPIEQPRFVIYVACNEPKVGQHGSDVAAPAAKAIAEFALRQLPAPAPQQ